MVQKAILMALPHADVGGENSTAFLNMLRVMRGFMEVAPHCPALCVLPSVPCRFFSSALRAPRLWLKSNP